MEPIKKSISQKEIAELVDISPGFLCHILAGRKECPRKVAERLQEATCIDRCFWVFGSPEEKREAIDKFMYPGL